MIPDDNSDRILGVAGLILLLILFGGLLTMILSLAWL